MIGDSRVKPVYSKWLAMKNFIYHQDDLSRWKIAFKPVKSDVLIRTWNTKAIQSNESNGHALYFTRHRLSPDSQSSRLPKVYNATTRITSNLSFNSQIFFRIHPPFPVVSHFYKHLSTSLIAIGRHRTVRVNCLLRDKNRVTINRSRTRTTWSRVQPPM